MNIILGADGHVGSAVAKNLLKKNLPVIAVLHSDKNEQDWKQQNAEVVIADINDANALHEIFKRGKKAFILNPPAPISKDNVALEKESVTSILNALKHSNLEKIVAESTYGAQPGNGIGDLGVLYELEQGLKHIQIPTIIIRAAYYMSNWDAQLEAVNKENVVHTLYPPGFTLPMVSPEDIGEFAAKFIIENIDDNTTIKYAEGPKQYSSKDVADAFAAALNKDVKAVQTPQAEWKQSLKALGFSDVAADSMVAMTKLTLESKFETSSALHGKTTLQDYINKLVKNA